jgi:hypothetical protein
MFVVASSVDADAPLASARDTAAIPKAGKALPRRFPFEVRFDMAQFPRPFGNPIDRFRMSSVMLRPAEVKRQSLNSPYWALFRRVPRR